MPRNPAGTYTFPALGNPAVTGTPITIAWWNGTYVDVATAITNSFDRTGATGGMTGQFKAVDGSAGAPGLTFGSDSTTGFSITTPGELDVSISGALVSRWTSAGFAGTFDAGSTWKFPLYNNHGDQTFTGGLDFTVSKLTIAGVPVRTTTAASVSSGSSTYTTTSTSFTTPTNLSISWTSTGGRAVISLQPTAGTIANALVANTGTTGTLKLTTGANTYQFDVTNLNGNMAPGAFMAVTPVLTAGSYTILCQVKTELAHTFSVTNCTLSVFEI